MSIDKKYEIMLFKKQGEHPKCQLKHFINFLNFNKVKKPIRFSYIDESGVLHNNLSLRENIYLDSIPTTLTSSKEFQLQNYLTKTGNSYLVELFGHITDIDKTTLNVSDKERKLVAIIKALIIESDYIFMECPEKHLNDELTQIFINALIYQINSHEQKVLFTSEREDIWHGHITQVVARDHLGQFSCSQTLSSKSHDKFHGRSNYASIASDKKAA